MEKKDLLKYLTDCKELELTIYNLQREQDKLNESTCSLGIPKNLFPPDKTKIKEKVNEKNTIITIPIYIIFILTICIIISIVYMNNSSADFWPIFVVSIVICSIVNIYCYMEKPEIIEGIIGIFDAIIHITRINRVNTEYQEAMRQFQLETQQDEKRIANENAEKSILQSRINDIERQKNKTTNTLNQLYAVGIVYPKYHALVPIVMFCEYIESGRCDALEGHEGAYNIYENELRQNIIISKLDAVINKLDQIRQNQYMLAAAIEEGNRHVAQLCSAAKESAQRLERIETNSVITAENARIAANNT